MTAETTGRARARAAPAAQPPAARAPAAGPASPVLDAKVSVPRLPRWTVRRERLERQLTAGVQGPLTVVTGPPGAGKTVAMAAWAAARPGRRPVAWLSLDGFDNEPGVFWSCLLAALRRAGAPLPPDLAAPAGLPAGAQSFLSRLASALAAQPVPVALVLDDIHLLANRATLDGLGYLLRYAGSGLRLVAASRLDPLLPLHRYRLAGGLAEIRAEDLAFRPPEAASLLAQHGISLPPAALAALTARNEGWAAGLRLAALSMAGHPDPERFVREFGASDSAVTSYLVDEVLGAQPGHVRDLLLRTSVLDRVSDGLACAVAGSPQAAGVIPALAEANAFIRPLGSGWYRYHALLAEVLRLKLRREQPGQATALRCRAARWLRRGGTLAEAVSQAAAAGAWQLAARIAVGELAVGQLLDPPAGDPLGPLLRPMPAGRAGHDPAACVVAAALAIRDGREDAAGHWLARAERTLARAPAGADPAARLAAALTRSALARRRGDPAAARAAAVRAQELLSALPGDLLARHPQARAQVLAWRGAAELWEGSPAGAAAMLAAADAAGGAAGWPDCAGQRALAEAARGRLARAAELAAAAAATSPAGQATPPAGQATPPAGAAAPAAPRAGQAAPCPASAAAEVALAWAALERNQLGDASGRLARAGQALRRQPDTLAGAAASLVAARERLARGRPRAAAGIARQARAAGPLPGWLDQRLMLAESQACAAAGDTAGAVTAARRGQPRHTAVAAVALARARLAAGEQAAAGEALAGLPASLEAAAEDIRLEARLVAAELAYASGHPDRGRRSLLQALRLASHQQLRLPVTMQRAWIGPVLRHDPALAAAFRQLLGPGGAAPGPPVLTAPAAGPVLEQLSAKEREVLRYAARMLSTAEIAGEMYVSVNTVKSHFKSIFRKLGATRRGEAVRRAQQLNLL